MRRRAFIGGIGAAAAWPLTASAQPMTNAPKVGFLSSRAESESAGALAVFRAGLADGGYFEGSNISIVYRWANGDYNRLPELASELVDAGVAALFAAGGPPSALAAKQATSRIPIVFSAVTDPVALGLVASLSHPGGNITGMSMFQAEVWSKTVALLKELLPNARVIAYLINPSTPNSQVYKSGASSAEAKLGIAVPVVAASTDEELGAAFLSVRQLKADGLVVPNEPFLDSRRDRIVRLARENKIPAAYTIREYVAAGGLMSYGPSLVDLYRKAAVYLARVLRGEAPASLPVEQPTKFELVINLPAAKALGLQVPPSLLVFADAVIE